MIRSRKGELSGWRYWRAVFLTMLAILLLLSVPFLDLRGLMGYDAVAELSEIGSGVADQSQIGDAPEILISRLTEADFACHKFKQGDIHVVSCSKTIHRMLFPMEFCCTLNVRAKYQDGKLAEPIDWMIEDQS